jgi:hypothetical protein
VVPYVAVTTADRIGAITYLMIALGPCELTLAEDPHQVSSTAGMRGAPGATGR